MIVGFVCFSFSVSDDCFWAGLFLCCACGVPITYACMFLLLFPFLLLFRSFDGLFVFAGLVVVVVSFCISPPPPSLIASVPLQ